MTTLPCGCCEPADPGPPSLPHNAAGLDALAWRIRRHPEFLTAMTTRLSRAGALRGLRTQESDDPTIALLDAWSAVLDVLTFYSERIANEGFLRTAVERRSVAELSAMVGYRLQPAVAAETHLAFELETAPGAPGAARIPTGTQVQSLPGPDEEQVLFETVADVDARAEWSLLPASATDGARPATGLDHCVVAGRPTLAVGDALLVARADAAAGPGDTRGATTGFVLVTVESAEPLPGAVRVHWTPPLPADVGAGSTRLGPDVGAVVVLHPTTARPFGHNAPDWRSLPAGTVAAFGGADTSGDWRRLTMDVVGVPGALPGAAGRRLTSRRKGGSGPSHAPDVIHLDGDDHDVRAGDLVVLADGGGPGQLFGVLEVATTSLTDFTLTRPVTRIRLSAPRTDFTAALRTTVVRLGGRPLALAPFARHEPHTDRTVPLLDTITPLPEGRAVAARGRRARVRVGSTGLTMTTTVSGAAVPLAAGADLVVLAPPEPVAEGSSTLRWSVLDAAGREGRVVATPSALAWVPSAEDGPAAAEVATAAAPDDPDAAATQTLTLQDPLTQLYDPATLHFNANVAPATHGETVDEVLGSGDAAEVFPQFALRSPLTYRATADGAESTLLVRVDGAEWLEQPTLFGAPGDARVYAVDRTADSPRVRFGDGRTGARPSSGRQNITARYRTGAGRAGNVAAGALSQLRTRPLGVKGVANPVPADGGADEESAAQARGDAPLPLRTLDRVVSVTDYGDFAAAYPGVGTALAAWVWDGRRRIVHVTCTGPDGGALPDRTRTNVRAAIATAGDGLQPFVVAGHEQLDLVVRARLHLRGLRDRGETLAAATAALTGRYGAPAAQLAESVPASSVVATLHAVPDVVGVDLLDFRRATTPGPTTADVVTVRPARVDEQGQLHGAQMGVLTAVEVVA